MSLVYCKSMLNRITSFSISHRKLVLVSWLVTLIALGVGSYTIGSKFTTSFTVTNSNSQEAADILKDRFPNYSGATGTLIFKSEQSVTDPSVRAVAEDVIHQIRQIEHVRAVASPYAPEGRAQISSQKNIAYATLQFDQSPEELPKSTTDAIKDVVAHADTQAQDIQFELGGRPFSVVEPSGVSEVMGLLAAAVVLLVAFGSVFAMGLPLITTLFGVGIGVTFILLLSSLVGIPAGATQLGAMMGLGVGIDYALFIVTRYRQELQKTQNLKTAIGAAMNTAGRSVIFAGITVIVSLLGMLLMDIGYVQGLGMAAAIVVFFALLASLTLLPALLSFIGKRIDYLKLPLRKKIDEKPSKGWRQWSRFIERKPWVALGVGLLVIGLLSLPAFSMQLGASDASTKPTSDTSRRAYDLQSEGFGIGANGPLLAVAAITDKEDIVTLEKVRTLTMKDAGVASVSVIMPNKDNTAAFMQLIPKTSPQDQRTGELIKRLREQIIPQATAGTNVTVAIGGITASFADLSDLVVKGLPIFIMTVLVASFLILMVVFRSILIPLKAIVLNMLSVTAAYGVVVAIFQMGWLKDIFGLGATGPIESFLPLMLFAILFGLSMDYEVFLLGRIQEEYEGGKPVKEAVTTGLFKSARIITAAALIMVAVFGGFALGGDRIIKEFGIGLAAAVIIDATIIRLLLVPASMHLFDKKNWWLPRWLQWLPKVKS